MFALRKGLFYVLLAAFGYSLFPVLTRSIYAASELRPTDVGVWRFILAVPLIWALVLLRERGHAPLRQSRRLQIFGLGVLYAMSALAAFIGLELINASLYIVLFYTYPAMVALLSLLGGKRLAWNAWVALGFTLLGVFLTVPDFSALAGEPLGVAMAFFNAFTVALYFLASARVLRGSPSMARSTAWVMSSTLLTVLIIPPIWGLRMPDTTQAWLLLALLAIVSTTLPIFALNAGIQALGAAQASIVATLEPVMSIIFAMIFLGEQVFLIQWLGAMCIVSAVLLLEVPGALRRQRLTASTG